MLLQITLTRIKIQKRKEKYRLQSLKRSGDGILGGTDPARSC